MDRIIEKSAFLFLLFLPIIPWISYLGFFILLFCFIHSHRFRHTPLSYYAYGLLGTVFLSCIFSINKPLSLGAYLLFICYFLGYFIFASGRFPAKKIANAIVLSGLILAVIGIVLYLMDFTFVFEREFIRIRFGPRTSTLGNPNRFAKYLVLTTPIAFAGLLFCKSLKEKVLPLVFIPLSFFSLWIIRSLTGVLAMSIAILAVLWAKNKWVALLVFVVGIGFYSVNYKKVNRLTSKRSAMERVNTLKYVVPKMFKARPITGCGLGAYREFALKCDKENKGLHYHAHNMYAHYLCETGILGLLAFLLFLSMFFYHSIRFLRSQKKQFQTLDNKWFVVGGMSSILGLLVYGISETCIDYLPIGLFFFSLIGIVTGYSRKES
ncbi:O-antigen ligase family protein [candidate division WOR-3 bacterium]|nr:O-antigen ligase family protein [candidate division WOR-3 bacterium]